MANVLEISTDKIYCSIGQVHSINCKIITLSLQSYAMDSCKEMIQLIHVHWEKNSFVFAPKHIDF